MEYLYIITFLIFIPIIWNILYSLRFESLFQQGKVTMIRAAYVAVSIIGAHLIAEAFESFSKAILNLFQYKSFFTGHTKFEVKKDEK